MRRGARRLGAPAAKVIGLVPRRHAGYLRSARGLLSRRARLDGASPLLVVSEYVLDRAYPHDPSLLEQDAAVAPLLEASNARRARDPLQWDQPPGSRPSSNARVKASRSPPGKR